MLKTKNVRSTCMAIGMLSLVAASAIVPIHQACAQQAAQISYSQDISPILRGWCVSCHQPGGQGYQASGFNVTTYEDLMKGTKFGPMVIPGQPDASSLVALIEGRTSPQISMPHGQKPLPSCLRDEIWSWVFQGAKNN